MTEQVPFKADQTPFGQISFADNPEPRCPCVLLLDVSGSMQGAPIQQLNAGLAVYRDELAADSLAAKRVELAIVTFGGSVQTVTEFTTADAFTAPTLTSQGDTPMGEAITQAIAMVTDRKRIYRENGIAYYRPWIFMLTDGGPTDSWKSAAEQVRQAENAKALAFFAVGVAGANFDILKQISTREPLRLDGLRFRDLFQWLSSSQQSVSRSQPGEEVALQNPATPGGWAKI